MDSTAMNTLYLTSGTRMYVFLLGRRLGAELLCHGVAADQVSKAAAPTQYYRPFHLVLS